MVSTADNVLQDAPAGELVLSIRGTSRDGQVIRIRSPKCTIGSGPRSTVRLHALGVLPTHCLIVRGPQATVIRRWAGDTLLNGATFSDAELNPGDRLRVGPIEFEVLDGNLPPDDSRNEASSEERPCGRETGHPAAPDAERAAQQSRLDDLARELDERAAEIEAGRAELDRLIAELDSREQEIIRRAEQLEAGAAERIGQSDEFARRAKELETREQELARRAEELEAQVAEGSSQAEEFERRARELEAREQELIRRAEELEAEAAERGSQSEEFSHRAEELEAKAAQLEVKSRELDDQAERLGARAREVQTHADELRESRHQLDAQSEQLTARDRELESQAESLNELAEQLAAQAEELEAERAELEARLAGLETAQTEENADSPAESQGEPAQQFSRETPTEVRFQEVSREAPLTSEEVFRRTGTVPLLPDDEEEEEEAAPAEPQQVRPPAAADKNEAGSEPEEEVDESIDQYMAQLLRRVGGGPADAALAGPAPASLASQPDKTAATKAEDPAPEPTSPQSEQSVGLAPRATAPEKAIDLSAMRELANFSAHQAIDRYARQTLFRSIQNKLIVAIVSAVAGAALFWFWWRDPANRLPLHAAVVSFVIALFWAVQNLVLTSRTLARRPGSRAEPKAQSDDQ